MVNPGRAAGMEHAHCLPGPMCAGVGSPRNDGVAQPKNTRFPIADTSAEKRTTLHVGRRRHGDAHSRSFDDAVTHGFFEQSDERRSTVASPGAIAGDMHTTASASTDPPQPARPARPRRRVKPTGTYAALICCHDDASAALRKSRPPHDRDVRKRNTQEIVTRFDADGVSSPELTPLSADLRAKILTAPTRA